MLIADTLAMIYIMKQKSINFIIFMYEKAFRSGSLILVEFRSTALPSKLAAISLDALFISLFI